MRVTLIMSKSQRVLWGTDAWLDTLSVVRSISNQAAHPSETGYGQNLLVRHRATLGVSSAVTRRAACNERLYAEGQADETAAPSRAGNRHDTSVWIMADYAPDLPREGMM